jgi:hypothetical protein
MTVVCLGGMLRRTRNKTKKFMLNPVADKHKPPMPCMLQLCTQSLDSIDLRSCLLRQRYGLREEQTYVSMKYVLLLGCTMRCITAV